MNKICFIGEYVFEFSPLTLSRGVEVINLTTKQLETLAVLVQAGGDIVHKDVFLEKVWREVVVEEHNLTQTIFMLRRTLGKLPNGQEYIETIPRRGYRLSPQALHPRQMNLPIQANIEDEFIANHQVREDRVHAKLASKDSRSFLASHTKLITTVLFILTSACAIYLGRQVRTSSYRPLLLRAHPLTRDDIYKISQSPIFTREGRLFFTETLHNSSYLANVLINGGPVTRQRLALPHGQVAAIHPEIDEAIVAEASTNETTDKPLLSMSSVGDSHHPIGDLQGHAASWSSDGLNITFTKGNAVFIADNAGKHISTVADFPGIPFWPAWSPDKKHIRVTVRNGQSQSNIWEVDLASRKVRMLHLGALQSRRACCGSWSADGKYYVYLTITGNGTSIWVRKEDSLVPEQSPQEWEIASGPVDFWWSPIISDDRKHIFAIGEQARTELVKIDRFLRGDVEPLLQGTSVGSASYSHNGQWVAYTLYPEGSLWKSRPDGSGKVQISQNLEIAKEPQWSADDTKILYLSSSEDQPWSIKEAHLSNSTVETLASDVFDDDVATYSPTNDRIIFSHRSGEKKLSTPPSITFLNLASKQREEIANSQNIYAPRWSPDGQYVVALTVGQKQLMLYDCTARTWTKIPASDVDDAIWDLSGDLLYFALRQNAGDSIMKLDMTTRKIVRVADVSSISKNGTLPMRLTITPKNQIALITQTGTSEVYDLEVSLP